MSVRPPIAAELAAALLAAIPARLVKKLDADPALADRWIWTATTVVTDKGETVHLDVRDAVVRGVTCTCLLGPKCLHVAAVVAQLEPAATEPPAPGEAPAPGEEAPPTAAASTARGDRAATAALAEHGLMDVLAIGAESCGAFVQSELLRAIHACRADGLHRLATAQTRVLRSVRALRADQPEVALSALTADLRDGLAVAHAIVTGDGGPAVIGRARRDYEPAGSLRLHGVLTEAIVAGTGYAGAVTYLIDEGGRFYSRADVAPGDAGRAAGAYEASAAIGDAVLPHRELGRSGLFVADATASADGRLGAGQRVRAVRASEPSRWEQPVIAARFAIPLAAQIAAIASAEADPDDLRPAGWDFVFVTGTIAVAGGRVVLVTPESVLALVALEHRALAGYDNLRALARAPGLRVQGIGRVRLAAPREVQLLALRPAADEPRLVMPTAWQGRANVHFDHLAIAPASADEPAAPAFVVAALAAATAARAPSEPGWDLALPLRRRVERAVLGGAGALPAHALAELDREAALLARCALTGGGELLRELGLVAHAAHRDATGARRPLDRTAFARAWLRAALYDSAVRRELGAAAWIAPG